MNNEEKMLKGLPYQNTDTFFTELRNKCQKALFHLNNEYHELEEKNEIIKKIINIDDGFYFELPFRCEYGKYIKIGKKFYANMNFLVLDGGGVEIGDNVMIGPNVSLYTPNHPLSYEGRNSSYEYAHKIFIGDNVWIGGSVTVNPGVTIGQGSVIGAGSVVVKDIPEYSLAVGNPCRVIKKITDEMRDKEIFEINKWGKEL